MIIIEHLLIYRMHFICTFRSEVMFVKKKTYDEEKLRKSCFKLQLSIINEMNIPYSYMVCVTQLRHNKIGIIVIIGP